MTTNRNEDGEFLMTAAELRFEAYLDDEPREPDFDEWGDDWPEEDDTLPCGCESGSCYCDDDGLTDVEADAMTLRDAGWGTDEDYGYYGSEDAWLDGSYEE